MGQVRSTVDQALVSSEEIQHAGRLGGMRDAFEHTRQDVDEISRSAAELGDIPRAWRGGLGVFRT